MRIRTLGVAFAFLMESPGQTEVRSSSASGFEVQSVVTVKASPADAYAMLGRIAEWWDPSHTYSGKATNLSLALNAGGCFCERLEGGGVEHMRVVQAQSGKSLRLQGGLGPLQGEGVTGTLTWFLKAVPGGTEITQNYIVGGYFRDGGGPRLAGPVGQVLEKQLTRLKTRLDR
jgi:hypothetical protein